jgi:hypothetical protein
MKQMSQFFLDSIMVKTTPPFENFAKQNGASLPLVYASLSLSCSSL